mgnify:CR=1 FL=1
MENEVLLQVKGLSFTYGEEPVLKDVNLIIRRGEKIAVMGSNGAGKSTIIKCIAGLLRFEGEIDLCGYPNKSLEAKALLGYIPEMPAVYDLLTVGEHLEFIARAYQLTRLGRVRRRASFPL